MPKTFKNYAEWITEYFRLIRTAGYKIDGHGVATPKLPIFDFDGFTEADLYLGLENAYEEGESPDEIVKLVLDASLSPKFVGTYVYDYTATPPKPAGRYGAPAAVKPPARPNLKNIKIKRNTAVMLAHLYLNGPASARTLTSLPGIERGGQGGTMPLGDRWGAGLFQTRPTHPTADAGNSRDSQERASLVARGLIVAAGKEGRAGLWKVTPAGVEALLNYSERTGESLDNLSIHPSDM